MIVYLFDVITNVYVGSYVCQENPLELGFFIVPTHSTTIEPPTFTELDTCKWDGSKWVITVNPVEEPIVQEAPVIIQPTLADLQAQMAEIQRQLLILTPT